MANVLALVDAATVPEALLEGKAPAVAEETADETWLKTLERGDTDVLADEPTNGVSIVLDAPPLEPRPVD